MAQEKRLYSLGLTERDSIDRKLGGGIPVGSTVLIEGDYGVGKSVFCQRFAAGFCERGYHVCYMTPELDLMSFLKQMDSLNYEIKEHFLENRFLFLSVSFSPGERYVQRLIEADRMWNGEITIIDAFDQILRNDREFDTLVKENKEDDLSSQVVSHFRDLIRADKTIIITIDPTNLSEDAMSPFRSVADVYFKLEAIDVGGERRTSLNVQRFSGMGSQVGDSIGYSVKANVGIVIESRTVV